MNWIIALIIGLVIGAVIGFVILAIIIVGSNLERLEEAYKRGFEEGKRASLSLNE